MTRGLVQSWEAAGLTVDELRLAARLRLPDQVERRGDWIVCAWTRPRPRRVRPSAKVLTHFLRIEDADDVVNFARRFGLLSLCKQHHLPVTHRGHTAQPPFNDKTSARVEECPVRYEGSYWGHSFRVLEPIAGWLKYARQTRAILSVAAAMHEGRAASKEDWSVIFEGENVAHDLRHPRKGLVYALNQWMILADARPSFTVDGWMVPHVRFTAGLFATLTQQLIAAVTSTSKTPAICSECRRPYVPSRRPREDERKFCDTCRKSGAPQRLASRDSRQRKRERKRTASVR